MRFFVFQNIKLSFSENFFLGDPRLKDQVPMEYLSHQEYYEETIRKTCILFDKIKEWNEITDTNIVDIYL